MHEAVIFRPAPTSPQDAAARLRRLAHSIEHAAHLLPSQGPITVFVHHNTLHAFEDQPFDRAVLRAMATYGCQPYLAEERYRESLAKGRIQWADLAAVLIDDLEDRADELLGLMGTRYQLRLAMLEHPWHFGTDAEVRWRIAETDALSRFRRETPDPLRRHAIGETRRWVMRDLEGDANGSLRRIRRTIDDLLRMFGRGALESWTEAKWEAFTLHLLWRICRHGVHAAGHRGAVATDVACRPNLPPGVTDSAVEQLIQEPLVRFCAAFLDQGLAHWPLPGRELGFFRSFLNLYRAGRPVQGWLKLLPAEIARIERSGTSPLEWIDQSLGWLGIEEHQREAFIQQSLLAMRGWAGLLWQMETRAQWMPHPAPRGTLVEYLAVRCLLERVAQRHLAAERVARGADPPRRASIDQRAYLVFQLAQLRGWTPADLNRLSAGEWQRLMREIESFSGLERRRVYHLAYERRYRHQTLDAVVAHGRRRCSREAAADDGGVSAPAYQVVCCIDEREESFRRHLEEIDPACETFGIAGFFGVAMYYRGVTDAHFRPLSPVNVEPRHYVVEEPDYSFEESSRLQAEARRALGRVAHRLHVGTRTFAGGLMTGLLGSLATFPLILRVLFPRAAAQLRRFFHHFVTPPRTHLRLERSAERPGPDGDAIGFTVEEMADIVAGVVQTIGLVDRFAPLVIITGHGSVSLNNPHEAAHDCGACGGGRGGPNARALAHMANDPRVRQRLAQRGLVIRDEVMFVGSYHNTCDDSMTYYDLDRLPASHRERFERARGALDEARRRNAHERCRRFESADVALSTDAALRHVEGRAEDLSQVRPEYGHATNALCFVGRRDFTRGLFLDRRAFLASYDPRRDDAESSVLTRLLEAVIPVCAGISLEYYFSHVDPAGYGCGTKLPHNITSLLGVMDGAASDLRPGLPWQMTEIHEPVRILFVIETTPEAMLATLKRRPALAQLVDNEWVQLATIDPLAVRVDVFRRGRFEPYQPETADLPIVRSSLAWYRGQRDHLGFATVADDASRSANGKCHNRPEGA